MENPRTINQILATGLQTMRTVPRDIQQDMLTMAAALREARERIQRVLDAEPEELELLFLDFQQMLQAWDSDS